MCTLNMKNDFFEYTLTRGDFAKRIGKSKEAVRSAMRRGQYAECYRFDGSQYLFKEPSRSRADKENTHGQKAIPKRQINRGNHHKANYPNESFRLYNQKKILEKLNKTDPGFVARVPELEKIYQQQKSQRITRDLSNSKIRNYGGMLYGGGLPSHSQVTVKPIGDRAPQNSSYFIGHASYGESDSGREDPGSVEITQHQIDSYGPVEERRSDSFKNKIEEDTYRARKALYKKTGEIY